MSFKNSLRLNFYIELNELLGSLSPVQLKTVPLKTHSLLFSIEVANVEEEEPNVGGED